MSSSLRRLAVTLTATALMLTGLTTVAPPRTAHAAMVCTWMTTSGPNTHQYGVARTADIGAISWNMLDGYGCVTGFPAGGSLFVRVQELRRTSSGCSGTVTANHPWRQFTSKTWKPLATVDPGDCFRLNFYAGNVTSAHSTHRGKLYY